MKVVAAPDKFRGTASASGIAEAVARGVARFGGTTVQLPMADGGEGLLEVLGGPDRTATVTGPISGSIEVGWRLSGETAVIEMARVAGLALVGGAAGNLPMDATTAGVGELVRHAVEIGARRVIVGVGGSATTDGGLGAVGAMGPPDRYLGVELMVACDVRTRFTEAAAVFGAQKGATSAQIKMLTRRLERLVQVYEKQYGVDVSTMQGAGAAGGLAGGLAALGADLFDGFDLVAEEVGLDHHLRGADLVVTGEGWLDASSYEGKVVGGVEAYAAAAGVPVLVVAGGADLDLTGSECVVSLAERYGQDLARDNVLVLVEEVVADALAHR